MALVAGRAELPTARCAPVLVRCPFGPDLNIWSELSVTTNTVPSRLAAIPNGAPKPRGTETNDDRSTFFPGAAVVMHPGAFRPTGGGGLLLRPPVVLLPPPLPLVSAYAAAPPPISTTTPAPSASADCHPGRTMLACGSAPPYGP